MGKSSSKPAKPKVLEEIFDYDEKLPLEGNWEFESATDEKDVPLSEIDYPPPEPCSRLDIKHIDFSEVDQHALSTKFELANRYPDLTSHLTSRYEDDLMKVRALIVWLSGQRIRTRTYNPPVDLDTPIEYMDLIKQKRGTFAAFFALLCRAADIPCVIIKGFCKTSHSKMYDIDLSSWKCTWNAVYVRDEWRIIHPYWICTPFAKRSSVSGNVIEIGGKMVDGNQRHGRVFNKSYFCPDPKDFIKLCFAEDKRWQLMETDVSRSDFASSPYLSPECFILGVKLLGDQKSIIQTNDGFGTMEVQVQNSKEYKTLEISYQLHHVPERQVKSTLKPINGAYVLLVRTGNIWTFQIRCPSVGTFQIAIFASRDSKVSKWLFDIQIRCQGHTGDATPLPFNPKDIGWGPGELTEKIGFLLPSHESGIIPVKEKDEITIKFILIHKIDFQVELINENVSQWDLKRSVVARIEKRELNITVKIPEEGEYILKVKTAKPKTKMYQSVCLYLLTNVDPRSKGAKSRESVPQRKARERLRNAVIGFDVDDLEEAVNKCAKEKIDANDQELKKAKERLRYIQLKKDLRDAVMRRRIDALNKAISRAKQSPFPVALRPNIKYSVGLRDQLLKLKEFGCSIMDLKQHMISELQYYHHPPEEVYESLKAAYILLGEDEEKLEHWVYIQTLLRKHGTESILSRINAFSGVVDEETLQKAKVCLKRVPEDKITHGILIGAHTFYSWTENVIKELETNTFHPKYEDRADVLETRRSMGSETDTYDDYVFVDNKERLQKISENGIENENETTNEHVIPRIVIN